jgi:hypothetical protein
MLDFQAKIDIPKRDEQGQVNGLKEEIKTLSEEARALFYFLLSAGAVIILGCLAVLFAGLEYDTYGILFFVGVTLGGLVMEVLLLCVESRWLRDITKAIREVANTKRLVILITRFYILVVGIVIATVVVIYAILSSETIR